MKNCKAPGEDGVTIKLIKEGEENINNEPSKLFNKSLKERNMPMSPNNAIAALLYEK